MCAPSPPPPPDYAGAAREQGAANKEAAIASARLNNPNVINPYGTQTWIENISETPVDQLSPNIPSGGGLMSKTMRNALGDLQTLNSTANLDVNRPTLIQTFSPEQQALLEQSNRVKGLLSGLGEQGARSLQGVVGRNLDLTGLPAAPGSAQDTRTSVINAMMSRVDEDTARAKDQANSQLIAAGIRPGTKAYDDRMALIDRGYNDARQQALLAAGQEAQRSFGMDTEARRNAMAEILAQRQTPLNEINALMSGSQVNNPFAIPGASQNANIAPAPLYNAATQAGQYGTDVYNAGVGQSNALMGGLFGLGSAGIGAYGMMNAAPMVAAASDRSVKQNIRKIGKHPIGVNLYEFEYKPEYRDRWGHGKQTGVMADEVEKVMPEAVFNCDDGYKIVNYGMIGHA